MIMAFKDAKTIIMLGQLTLAGEMRVNIPIYVRHEIFANEGPVIITTRKFHVQLLACASG
jgi:hypothetical protein